MDPWSRRDFLRAGLGLTGLSLLAGCTARMPRIGFLAPRINEDFLRGLREHGYEDGRNIHIEYRFSEGRHERLSELATELVDLQPDVLVTVGPPAGLAAKQATSTIPIVAASVPDPVGSGLVASLARPGGNVTGVSTSGNDTDMKRMERLKEVVPTASRVAVLGNPNSPATGPRLANFEAAAQTLGQQVRMLPARTADDLAGAFAAAVGWGADALLVPSGGTLSYATRVVELAAQHRLPDFYEHREFSDLGGLATFGPNYAQIFWRAAAYVDKILKGAKPADLPFEQPATFDFVINLKTAQVLGLTISQEVLAQTTEVIQ
jgi:putative ABC transport system substrate-binding protein